MGFYPLLIDLQGLPCLVAGGGALAKHKVELLVGQGAAVTVVAPEISPEIRALPVAAAERRVRAEDAEGKALVVDATGDADAELLLREACRRMHIPFNSACRLGDGTAVFPAVHQTGRTVVAVSTLGASPAACTRLRDQLAAHVPKEMDAILDGMAALRPLSRHWFDDQGARKRFLHRCLDEMLKQGRPLAPEETEVLRQEIIE
jgi:siroheme synthase-like protein